MHILPRKTLSRTLSCVVGAALTVLWMSAAAAPPSDAQILAIYIQVNGFDIDTALLGRSQADSASVRELAQHVAADHLGVRRSVYEIAAQCNVSPALPAERNAAAIEHDKVLEKLIGLTGAAFDRAYLEHEVAFHRAAIEAVRSQLLPATRCPQLQAHFKAVMPALEHHLRQTEELAAGLTGSR